MLTRFERAFDSDKTRVGVSDDADFLPGGFVNRRFVNFRLDKSRDFDEIIPGSLRFPNGFARFFRGIDDKIIALYARGLSVEDIQQQLLELYGVDVSSSLISNVTASVIDDVKAWQSRPLDALYPIVYLDCLVVKVKEDKRIMNKSGFRR